MRYEIDENNYIVNVYFGCYGEGCTEYTGTIPENYDTLAIWAANENINAWKIVDGNLVFDAAKAAELEMKCELENRQYTPATQGYVDDKMKVSNNYISEELAVEKTGNQLITIIDTGNYVLPELKVTSNAITSFRAISSNKNLLGVETISTTINGVEITNNVDGTITLNGTATAAINIDINGSNTNTKMLYLIEKNTKYTISGLTNNVSLYLYSNNGTDKTFVNSSSNGSFTLSSSYIVTQTVLSIPSGAYFKDVVISPQIEIGNATSFVKHEETNAIGFLEENNCSIYDLNSYAEKTIIMLDKNVAATVKYYKYQYLNEQLSEFKVTEEEVKSTLVEINETVDGQDQKISEISQKVGELNSKISETADITTSRESLNGTVTLDGINESEPIFIKIYPINESITYIYPRENLYPSNNLVTKTVTLRFTNKTTNEIVNYELPSDLLYYDVDVYDEFILDYETQTCTVTKRVEYNQDGTTYVLDTPRIIQYEYPKILLTDGDEYEVSLVGYTSAYMFIRLMASNIYTTQFATKAEMYSEIQQLSDEINLEVGQKVNEDEIIASLNVAVKEGQGIINLTGNQVTINSDNFELNADGTVTAKAGIIAGLVMERDSNKSSNLSKSYINNGMEYQSGLHIPDTTNGNDVFLYAGSDYDIANAPARITHNGDAYFRNIKLNAQSGSCSIDYDSGNKAIDFYTNGISFRLDDDNNNQFGSLFKDGAAGGFFMNMLSAKFFGFIDLLHPAYQAIFYIYRCEPNDNQNHEVRSYADIKVWGNRVLDNINNSIYIQGYEVATNASDERLKENKETCKENALDILNNIEMISFDWKEDLHTKNAGKHIPIGYGAQRTQKVYENAVVYNEENDTYQMDLLNLSALHTKAIQELNAKIEKRDKVIEFLAEKLNCKNEVLEMLKEGE